MDLNQLVLSQQSAPSMDSAESTAAAAAARAPNGTAQAVVDGLDFDDDDDDAVPEMPACIAAMLDRGSVESKRLFLARRTALEMLRDRGYAVAEDELARTLPEFRAWWEAKPELERLAITTTLAADPSSKVKVLFCPPEPVKLAAIRVVYTEVKDENLSRLILILQGRIMSKAREAIKEIFPYKVDTFQITELLVNITKHALKPKHQVLTAEEKAKLLKEYNVVDQQLPRMQENDAVARYYGLGKGTVVKVLYDSELTGNHVTYRCIF